MTIPSTAAQASAYTQSNNATNVQTTVAAKVNNVARQQGADALKLLSSATIPSAPAHGGSLDVQG